MNSGLKHTIEILQELNFNDAPKGKITRYWLEVAQDGMGFPIKIPIMVAKGVQEGKIVGITAAVHGNELNGVSVIQKVFKQLAVDKLTGTVVGIPIVNVPSYLRKKRRYLDGTDLNHIMPGKKEGNVSQHYAWQVVNKIITQFDYLIDLHTASNGRINSYYIRADMSDEVVRKMAMLQNAQIIVHNPPNDGTLRGTAGEMEIPAITMEVGNPNTFQKGMIRDSLTGIHNLLTYFNFIEGEIDLAHTETVICRKSFWIYTDIGGLLTVYPNVTQRVEKGEKIASITNVFGDVLKSFFAPTDGIVIGKSVNPMNYSGGRILHLGVEK